MMKINKDKGISSEAARLRARVEELEAQVAQFQNTEHALEERLKELRCLNELIGLLEAPHLSVDDFLELVVALIPPAYQRPGLVCARILLPGKVFTTEPFAETEWTQSAEIIVSDRQEGVIEVFHASAIVKPDSTSFLREEQSLIGLLAKSVGQYLTRKKLETQYLQLLDQQLAINQLALSLGGTLAPQNIYQTLYKHIHHLVKTDEFFVYVYDPQNDQVTAEFAVGDNADLAPVDLPSIQLAEHNQDGLNQVIQTGQSYYAPAHRHAGNSTAKQEKDLHSDLYVPMKVMGDVVGVLQVKSYRPDAYTQEVIDLLTGMASMAAMTFQNARLIDTLEETVALRTAELKGEVQKLDKSQKAMLYMVEDLNQTAATLKMEQQKLALANQELEAFSYSVSHDLRAPLRHIKGYIDLLLKRFPDSLPEKGEHYLANIVDSAQEMGVLIDSLLLFSKTSRQEMYVTRVDMNDLVEETLINLRPDYAERDIEWTIGPLPHVLGDRYLLKLVWFNLLSNAIKFTQKQEQAEIEVGFQEQDNAWFFFVRDNGVGFEMKYAQKLFGVFQRLHGASEFEGTGIGLANLRRIIQRHGGRAWAEGAPGQGATFYFSLPK